MRRREKSCTCKPSVIAGITLPQGAKKDLFLCWLKWPVRVYCKWKPKKKAGVTVNSIEVLYVASFIWPRFAEYGLKLAGWTVTPSATDNSYWWLQKDRHSLLACLVPKKTSLNYILEKQRSQSAGHKQWCGSQIKAVKQNRCWLAALKIKIRLRQTSAAAWTKPVLQDATSQPLHRMDLLLIPPTSTMAG